MLRDLCAKHGCGMLQYCGVAVQFFPHPCHNHVRVDTGLLEITLRLLNLLNNALQVLNFVKDVVELLLLDDAMLFVQ